MSHTKPVRTSIWGQIIKRMLVACILVSAVGYYIHLKILSHREVPVGSETIFFVHIRADLNIDNEPLVMDRVIRCFHMKDRGRIIFESADSLMARTSTGRTFALIVPEACDTLVSRRKPEGGAYTVDPTQGDVPPLRLSKDELITPVVFEIMGGVAASRVDAYVAFNRLRQGYHGVRLDDVLIEKAASELTKDWTYEKERSEDDWFGPTDWGKHGHLYYAVSFVPITRDYWQDTFINHPELRAYYLNTPDMYKQFDYFTEKFSKYDTDTYLVGVGPYGNFGEQGFAQVVYGLRKESPANTLTYNKNFKYSWALERIIPCVFTGTLHNFKCSPELDGVLQFKDFGTLREMEMQTIGPGKVVFSMPAFTMTFGNDNELFSGFGSMYRKSDETLYVLRYSESYLGRTR